MKKEIDRMVFRALTKVEDNEYYSTYLITNDGYYIDRFSIIKTDNDDPNECDNRAIEIFRNK